MMYSEARKLDLIEKMLRVNSEAVLSEIEAILKTSVPRDRGEEIISGRKPSAYAGCISKKRARELIQEVEKSRDEWETRGI